MAKTNPEISVLMPVYNGVAFVDTAIQSIRNQDFKNWELLIIDDGSSDDTCEIASTHAMEDKRILVHSIGRKGLVEALNSGLEKARGKIVARMDADDISMPSRLEKQLAMLRENDNEAVVSCLVKTIYDGESAEGMMLYEEWLNSVLTPKEISDNIFVESPIAHPTAMFWKETVVSAGGYMDYGWPEDYDLWMRLYLKGVKFQKVPEVLYEWQDREGRMSRTSAVYSHQAFKKLKAHYLLKKLEDNNRQIVILGAGKTGRWWCRELITSGMNISAFLDIDEGKIGKTIGNITIYDPGFIQKIKLNSLILGCVSDRGERKNIIEYLYGNGLCAEKDFIMLA